MTRLAEIRLWGNTIGAVSLAEGEDVAAFEYSADFSQSGIEPSPIVMPLSRRVYRFPALSRQSFQGLPGLLADSLPDRFGNALIDTWLARQGRRPESFNAVERLCYTGKRGMGALEFFPARGPETRDSESLDLDRLVELASEVLAAREHLNGSLSEDLAEDGLRRILRVGTSAGGARAKAVVAWNPMTQEVRSGQVPAPEGFEYWLLKFDGVSSNRDKELTDGQGYGSIEYAYYLMARAAGVRMNESRLLKEKQRRHFMTRRFDRGPEGQKIHMQSLGALAHYDFNMAGANSYEQVFEIIRRLGLGLETVEEQFRRMVFNVLSRNQDDHVKNIAFLMDRQGRWSLAPAFDVTYSYTPSGLWTGSHQMSLNGRRNDFAVEDLRLCAQTAGLKRGRFDSVMSQVFDAVSRWLDFASEAELSEIAAGEIRKNLRLNLLP